MIRFKEHRLIEMAMTVDDVEFILTKHFSERMKERGSEFSMDAMKGMLKNIKSKLTDLPATGEFLFFSKKLKQGIVATWDAFKSKMSLITFLPKGKEFPGKDTEKVYVESMQRDYIYIEVD